MNMFDMLLINGMLGDKLLEKLLILEELIFLKKDVIIFVKFSF